MATDIFKILTRSTKLSKSKQPATPKIPSSSDPRPQIYGKNTTDHTGQQILHTNDDSLHIHGSKKRKRGQNLPDHVPEALDFFGDAKARTQAGVAQAGNEQDSLESESHDLSNLPNGHNNESPPSKMAIMGEEESKSLLRSHKIKIHVLEDDTVSVKSPDRLKVRKRRKHKEVKQEVKGKSKAKTQLFPQPIQSFHELRQRYNISRRLAENIEEQGYKTPTEVQMASIPVLLGEGKAGLREAKEGSHLSPDLLSVAPTGSGKTLAFLIPIMDSIMRKRNDFSKTEAQDNRVRPIAIVVAPTKELAAQISNEGRKLAVRTGIKVSLLDKTMILLDDAANDRESDEDDVESVADGEKRGLKQQATWSVKSHIIVSTPMTLVHAITAKNGGLRSLPNIEHLVLDEADVLLDALFREQTLAIWSACTSPSLSTTLWSATMGSSIENLVRSTRALRRVPDTDQRPLIRLIVGLKDTALPTISHRLIYAANEAGKLLAIRQLLHPTAPYSTSDALTAKDAPLRPPFLVFTQTIPRAIALASELRYDIPAEAGGSMRIAALHADLSDKQRDDVMTRFRKGEVWVLVTTDLLARGVDFRGINGVVNYDVPTTTAAYIHRVGRTGRAGREGGVAVTLYAEEDVSHVRGVANVIAASQKGSDEVEKLQMLLDTLPTPGRREKKRLKMRGVEARRPGNEDGKVRITTKSGYERRMERRRKDAIQATKQKVKTVAAQHVPRKSQGRTSDFEGFDD